MPFKGEGLLMVEDLFVCTRRAYHQQKLALIIGAMRHHGRVLSAAGFEVEYRTLEDACSIEAALTASLSKNETLHTFVVSDRQLRALLERVCRKLECAWVEHDDPGFLSTVTQFRDYADLAKQLKMADFYARQRKRLSLLLDEGGKPLGGRWSFDAENRKKLPKKQSPPAVPVVEHDQETRAVMAEISARFPRHPGRAEDLWLPVDRPGALAWLDRFLEERLLGFGTYEDALTPRGDLLFHSALSPLMNLGLVTPDEVIERVLARAEQVPLNDIEGFVRQVIGWREFVRGVYETHGDAMRSTNARDQRRRLTAHWHDGTTGIPPLDDAIEHQQRLGWTHHINRLMVIANLMNLCEIDPTEVYEYFMTYYLDAYDWVMVPNVFGMGLNSDGGVFATKPYVCGSNYLLKMSDFPKGPWCDTVDGLYWRFIERHRSELEGNPRLSVMTRGLDRMDVARRQKIFAAAEGFLETRTR